MLTGTGMGGGQDVRVVWPPVPDPDPFTGRYPWDPPDLRLCGQEIVYRGVLVGPDWEAETPTSTRPARVPGALNVFMPYGEPVWPECTVTILTGPYASDRPWQVDGTPAHWVNPLGGQGAGTVVRVIRTEG